MKIHVVLVVATLSLAGCSSGAVGPSETAADVPAFPDETFSLPALPAGLPSADLESLMQQAATDTGVAPDEIQVITAEAVTWSDGSIGCPEEGMAYTQALVPGYRVILDIAGEEIHYHAGSDGEFFACDDPQEPTQDGTTDR